MFRINIDTNVPRGWVEYYNLYCSRILYVQRGRLNLDTIQLIGIIIEGFIHSHLASGVISWQEEWDYYARNIGQGMYGAGTPEPPQPDWLINPLENLGGVDTSIARNASGGPRFLESLRTLPPVRRSGTITFTTTTEAKMTPYPKELNQAPGMLSGIIGAAMELPEMPIMHYFRHGWMYPGGKPRMRPRLGAPGQEVARFILTQNKLDLAYPNILRDLIFVEDNAINREID